eukprot:COSAG05_NODE_2903_length_2524_cov_2.885773_1_plen_652_part_00
MGDVPALQAKLAELQAQNAQLRRKVAAMKSELSELDGPREPSPEHAAAGGRGTNSEDEQAAEVATEADLERQLDALEEENETLREEVDRTSEALRDKLNFKGTRLNLMARSLPMPIIKPSAGGRPTKGARAPPRQSVDDVGVASRASQPEKMGDGPTLQAQLRSALDAAIQAATKARDALEAVHVRRRQMPSASSSSDLDRAGHDSVMVGEKELERLRAREERAHRILCDVRPILEEHRRENNEQEEKIAAIKRKLGLDLDSLQQAKDAEKRKRDQQRKSLLQFEVKRRAKFHIELARLDLMAKDEGIVDIGQYSAGPEIVRYYSSVPTEPQLCHFYVQVQHRYRNSDHSPQFDEAHELETTSDEDAYDFDFEPEPQPELEPEPAEETETKSQQSDRNLAQQLQHSMEEHQSVEIRLSEIAVRVRAGDLISKQQQLAIKQDLADLRVSFQTQSKDLDTLQSELDQQCPEMQTVLMLARRQAVQLEQELEETIGALETAKYRKEKLQEQVDSLNKQQEQRPDSPPSQWSVPQVGRWLSSIGASIAVQASFTSLGIDGGMLLKVLPKDLRNDLHVSRRSERDRIMVALRRLKTEHGIEADEYSDRSFEESLSDCSGDSSIRLSSDDDEARQRTLIPLYDPLRLVRSTCAVSSV